MSTSSVAGAWRPWATVVLTLVMAAIVPARAAEPVAWQSWTFDYEVSGNDDGLSLLNVTFQGRPLIAKLSFPVMRVFYDQNVCGPYADRLGGTLSPIPWAGGATIAQREFTLNGQQWYEIGIRDQIGSYDIYQVYYLGADGTLDAHIYSKGLQCLFNHVHYPNWRIDFDLDGEGGDQILRDRGAGFEIVPQEFNVNAASAINHSWRVRDIATGLTVDVLPGFPDFVIPDGSTTEPVTVYDLNTVFGRVYDLGEDTTWSFGPNFQVPFNNGESIIDADTVLWYEGYLPHSAAEGSALWHSTGVRLVPNLGGTPPPLPPQTPDPGKTQDFAGGALTIRDVQSGTPYPSTATVAGMDGTIMKITVRINGLTHSWPDDIDLALVGPDGQAVMLMSDAGGGTAINGRSLTFDSAAAGTLPDESQLSSGTYRPANYGVLDDVFPPPAPIGLYGTNLDDVFNGLDPNGTWQLYVVDDQGGDAGSISSWILTITTTNTTPPPPDSTPDAFTFTDVTGVALGALQTSNAVPIVGINTPVPVSVTGGEYSIDCSGTFTTVAGTVSSGQTVCVRHTSASVDSTSIDTTLTVGGVADTFTSTTPSPPPGSGQIQAFSGGAVTVSDNQPGTPYPSIVSVAGMGGTVTKVTVRLDGVSHSFPDDLDVALVGPGGQAVMLMSDAGGGTDVSGVSLTFDSGAAGTLPDGSQLISGVFQPENYEIIADPFPAPAPTGPFGDSLDVFNGLGPNGTWELYVVDDTGGDAGSIGAWVLTVTATGTTTPDSEPDSFAFTDLVDVALDSVQTSNAVTITGINTAAAVSVTGGEYALGCGGVFTAAPGTIDNGETVCVRHTSAATHDTATDTTLTVGGVADTFTSTTTGLDTDSDGIPDAGDNCTLIANPTQCDSDGDGFGNHCDGDLNNNGFTNTQDYVLFRAQLGQPSVDPTYNQADLNCSGSVNSQDYVLFRGLLGSPPGPSGLVP